MPTDRIQDLRHEVAEAFQDVALPSDWDDDWIFVPVDSPEAGLPQALGGLIGPEADELADAVGIQPAPTNVPLTPSIPGRFPGAPISGGGGSPRPPDALAFYLPFHYFHPTWWGIYLTVEGMLELARIVRQEAPVLTAGDAMLASQVFLHGHEAFHHQVECFATRLEVTHREALYRLGFERVYQGARGTDECIEEALANAHSLHRAAGAFRKDRTKREAATGALRAYVRQNPPGYRRGVDFEPIGRFHGERARFSERNHQEALAHVPTGHPRIWGVFPHAFSGLSRVTSRVNYIVHRQAPLVERLRLRVRFLRYRDVARRLRELGGAELVGSGKGSHEKWRARSGKLFPVPRHPGDLATGTLAKIVKQAGLEMSVEEFIRA